MLRTCPDPQQSPCGPRRRETPTFAQTVTLIQTMPPAEREDLEAIKRRHLAFGFTYQNDQIHRALAAITRRPGARSS